MRSSSNLVSIEAFKANASTATSYASPGNAKASSDKKSSMTRTENNAISSQETSKNTVDKGGSPPHDGNMEARIEKLESFAVDARESLAKIEARLDQTATKSDIESLRADVHKGFTENNRWVIGTAFAGMMAFVTIMTFVLNNAVPKAQAPTHAPVIINIPGNASVEPTPASPSSKKP